MKVYRAWYGWFDEYTHIGIFHTEIGAWIGCYRYYKKNLKYKVCWDHFDDPHLRYGCKCHKHRLRSSRYRRLYITKETLQ